MSLKQKVSIFRLYYKTGTGTIRVTKSIDLKMVFVWYNKEIGEAYLRWGEFEREEAAKKKKKKKKKKREEQLESKGFC